MEWQDLKPYEYPEDMTETEKRKLYMMRIHSNAWWNQVITETKRFLREARRIDTLRKIRLISEVTHKKLMDRAVQKSHEILGYTQGADEKESREDPAD